MPSTVTLSCEEQSAPLPPAPLSAADGSVLPAHLSQPAARKPAVAVPGLAGDDFAAVFKSRDRARSEHFSLHWRLGEAPVSRFGMVVAKRLTRTAIRRNLIKRQGRALFELALKDPAADLVPRDVVLRLTRDPRSLSRAEQYAQLQGLFKALVRSKVPRAPAPTPKVDEGSP